MLEIVNKVPPEERTPYVVVAFQECERMNMLTVEIRRSLKELDLGLKVFIIFSTLNLLVITFENSFTLSSHSHRIGLKKLYFLKKKDKKMTKNLQNYQELKKEKKNGNEGYQY